jgi:hypothetical protein
VWAGFQPRKDDVHGPRPAPCSREMAGLPLRAGQEKRACGGRIYFFWCDVPGRQAVRGSPGGSGLFGYFFQDPVILDLDCPVIIIF